MIWFILYLVGVFLTLVVIGALDGNDSSFATFNQDDEGTAKVMLMAFWPVALLVMAVYGTFVGLYALGKGIGSLL